MSSAAELRAKIASGAIKVFVPGQGAVGAGKFEVMLESITFGVAESGNQVGKITYKVIGAEDPIKIGRKFIHSIQTIHSEFLEQTIAEFVGYCSVWGIDEGHLYDRAENTVDVLVNICTELQRLAIKGLLFAKIERVPQIDKATGSPKLNNKSGKPMYHDNILQVMLGKIPITPAAAPVAPSAAAPVAPSAAAPVAPIAKKPWMN